MVASSAETWDWVAAIWDEEGTLVVGDAPAEPDDKVNEVSTATPSRDEKGRQRRVFRHFTAATVATVTA